MSLTVSAERLTDYTAEIAEGLGAPEDRARLLAESLVAAELWGHPSHGVMRLAWYAARIRTGAIQPDAPIERVMDAGALALLDGHDGIGQVVAAEAMALAVEKAQAHGVGAVSVRRSGHFGTAMFFTRRAAAAGCVALLSTNASPAMAPHGGKEQRVGANPWSLAAPAGARPPMALDISNTAVARGKLHVAKARGVTIPEGWAVDAEGRPTTDPAAGIAGAILPMAGHKGYAIGLMMDVLSGVLAGGAFGTGVVGPYVPEGPSGASHFAIAIDIAACRPLAAFEADMERLIDGLKATPRADGVDEIFYPGEIEARAEVRARREGITLPRGIVESLGAEATAVGVTPLA